MLTVEPKLHSTNIAGDRKISKTLGFVSKDRSAGFWPWYFC